VTSVFLDCEFDALESPLLLSIGLVVSDGRELYVELPDSAFLDDASEFVLDTVVPQFRLVPSAVTTHADLGRLVGDWLIGLGDGPIAVHYDYHSDFDLLELALEAAGLWIRLKDSLTPTHIGYLIGQPDVEAAMEASWAASFAADGIARHHALADARALRAGYEAVHGAGPALHLGRFDGDGVESSQPLVDQELTPEQVAWFESQVADLQRLNDDEGDDGVKPPEGVPILFLDLDDVLCLSDPYGGWDAFEAVQAKRVDADLVFKHLFHQPAVEVLRSVHQRAGAIRYVVTSTWRSLFNRSQFAEVLRRSGLEFVADSLERKGRWATVHWPERTRLNEIAEWLRRHGKGEPFAVIDDTYSGGSLMRASKPTRGPFRGRIVLCDEKVGLLPEHVEALVVALRRPVSGSASATSPVRDAGSPTESSP
jgi:hypothetical protein